MLSALSQGLAFSFYTLGIAIAFRWVKFPDLTGEGSFTLGAIITTSLVSLNFSVWIAMPVAMLAGYFSGIGTYSMYKYLKVPKILAGILMTMALYTINLRVLGRPNLQFPRNKSIFSILPVSLGAEWALYVFLIISIIVLLGFFIVYTFLESRSGLTLRVSGANPKMATIHGISPKRIFWGLGLANALIALSGALIAQRSYNADIHMGVGQIIVAVAALFIGMVIFSKTNTKHLIAASITGSVVYMFLMQLALEIGVRAQDFRLISTLIVLSSIVIATKSRKYQALSRGTDVFGID